MKNITDRLIDNTREIEYSVSFLDIKDSKGGPFTVRIMVEKKHQHEFEKWLEDERDNSIMHADGGDVSY